MANVVRAALVQTKWTGDTDSMIDVHELHAREAASQGAQIMGFQEVFNSPYFCQVQDSEHYRWAEEVPDGPTVQRMQALAKETGMVLVVPVFEEEQAGFFYNTAAVIDADGSYLGKYRKHHIPQVKGFWEKFYFRPGNLGWPVFDTAVGKVGVYICYDRHFPEGWRALGLAGAQIVYNPSATSRGLSSYLWTLEQPAAAVANEYFIAAINRVGVEEYGDNDFYGTSYFVDPRGQFVGDVASDQDEELVVRDLDFGLLDEVRQLWAFYRDRRPEAYGPPDRGIGAGVGAHGDLYRRHQAVMPSWLATFYDEPIEIERGEGRHVWDGEGNRYLDFFGGILTTMTAHALPEVTKAVSDQAGKVLHTSTLYLIRPMVELAERVTELSGIPDAKVFFTASGTEANDAAMLLATNFRRSNQVLALRNSYHGRSFSAIAVTGNRGWSASSLSPVQTFYVHGGYRYRSPFGHLPDDEYIAACVADLDDVITTQTAGDVACLIAEPIQGVGGFTLPPDGLLGAFKEVLDRHGILWISDEVQTGWGRTGENFWGWEAHADGGATPDMLTFAKGIGNGLSIGGVVARAEVMDCLGANSISTFGGSPVTSAGALANLEYLLDHDLQGNAHRVGGWLLARLAELGADLPIVGDVRGKGLMIGVELVRPGTKEPAPEIVTAALEGARRRGLLVGKGGLHGNVFRIAPPLSLTQSEAEEGFAILADALAEAGR